MSEPEYHPWAQYLIAGIADTAFTTLIKIQQRLPDAALQKAITLNWLALLFKPISQLIYVRRQFSQLNNYDYSSFLVSELGYLVAPLFSTRPVWIQVLLLCSAGLSVYLGFQGYKQHIRYHD